MSKELLSQLSQLSHGRAKSSLMPVLAPSYGDPANVLLAGTDCRAPGWALCPCAGTPHIALPKRIWVLGWRDAALGLQRAAGCAQAAEARELVEARACCAAAKAPPPAHGGSILMTGGPEARARGADIA